MPLLEGPRTSFPVFEAACAPQLESEGHKCTSIQGDMEKDARDRVVDEFRSGTTKILIATDVLARGFDVTQVHHIS